MYYYNYLNLLEITRNIFLLNKIHEAKSIESLDLRFLIKEEKLLYVLNVDQERTKVDHLFILEQVKPG